MSEHTPEPFSHEEIARGRRCDERRGTGGGDVSCEHSCYIDGDGDPPSVYSERLARAVMDYRCGECGEAIPRGTLYEYVKGLWDGCWSTHRTCLRCLGVRTDCFRGGWAFGALRDDFRECNGFDYVTEPEKLWQRKAAP